MMMQPLDHLGFGAAVCKLGDVNGDGYNDMAISTSSDTTFIFFGGPNFTGKPDAWLLGGGSNIVAGDFNGDGYPDIITAQLDYNKKIDPDRKGLVRVYLHNHTATMYDSVPNLVFTGQTSRTFVGSGIGYVQGGDVNGDGLLDLLIEFPMEPTPAARGAVHLYLGKPKPDTISDFIFRDTHLEPNRSPFGEVFFVRDVNGDGIDDIIIRGISSGIGYNYEVHMGNHEASFGLPNRDLINIQQYYLFIEDFNGDGHAEWFVESKNMNQPFSWGKMNILDQTLTPDDSFPNPAPGIFNRSEGGYQMSYFNGTKDKCFQIGWGMPSNNLWCWIYQSGPGWCNKPIARYGISVPGPVYGEPFDVGDITGDNIPDFAILGSTPDPSMSGPVWLYKGDKTLVSADQVNEAYDPSSFFLGVYPNPVDLSRDNTVYAKFKLDIPATVHLSVVDVLGRTVMNIQKEMPVAGPCQIAVNVGTFTKGAYFILLEKNRERAVKPLTIIKY